MPDNTDKPFSWLTDESATIFAPAIREGFSLLDMGSDHHGSLEWVAGKPEPDMSRYIILAIAQLGTSEAELPCEVEVSIGADDGFARFMRQSIASRMIANGRASLRDETGWMTSSVVQATQRVLQIEVQDLIWSRPIVSRRLPS